MSNVLHYPDSMKAWKWALCVYFRSRFRVQHLFGFKKAFNLSEWVQSILDILGSPNEL